MSFRPSRSIQLAEVLEYLSSTSQVRSSLGNQLGRIKDGITGGGDNPDIEQGMIDRANLSHCVTELERQHNLPWATTDVLPLFARRVRLRPGAVVIAVLRAYQPWHCDIDARRPAGDPGIGAERGPDRGLAEVYGWMCGQDRSAPRPEDIATLSVSFKAASPKTKEQKTKAAYMLADADVVLGEWVDMWNRKQGFSRHITVAEFSLRYGVPEYTVRRWCANGKLDAVMVGDVYKIDITDIVHQADAEATSVDLDADGLHVTGRT